MSPTLRLLAQLWLSEATPANAATLAELPVLADHLPTTPAGYTELAIEYQRLFGFNVPPYESVFVDPSAMLDAPATARVAALYERAGWKAPTGARVGAVDHVGLELLALADLIETGPEPAVDWLVSRHLALWLPTLVLALATLRPHPFYGALAHVSRDLVLQQLPMDALTPGIDPFPKLPPPPIYRASDDPVDLTVPQVEPNPADLSLRRLVRHLLSPRSSGFYLTKAVIAELGRVAELPIGTGERGHMLEGMLRAAGQYESLTQVAEGLADEAGRWAVAYAAIADTWPAWQGYAGAWTERLRTTQDLAANMTLHSADLLDG